MADENDHPGSQELESREPTLADLRSLGRELNHRQACYVVVGGFAMAATGYNRRTMDVDLLVDTSGAVCPVQIRGFTPQVHQKSGLLPVGCRGHRAAEENHTGVTKTFARERDRVHRDAGPFKANQNHPMLAQSHEKSRVLHCPVSTAFPVGGVDDGKS